MIKQRTNPGTVENLHNLNFVYENIYQLMRNIVQLEVTIAKECCRTKDVLNILVNIILHCVNEFILFEKT